MRADWNGVGHPPGVNGPLIRGKEMWAPRLKHTRRFKQLWRGVSRPRKAKDCQSWEGCGTALQPLEGTTLLTHGFSLSSLSSHRIVKRVLFQATKPVMFHTAIPRSECILHHHGNCLWLYLSSILPLRAVLQLHCTLCLV